MTCAEIWRCVRWKSRESHSNFNYNSENVAVKKNEDVLVLMTAPMGFDRRTVCEMRIHIWLQIKKRKIKMLVMLVMQSSESQRIWLNLDPIILITI